MRTTIVAALSLVVATFLPVVPAAQMAQTPPPPRKLELTFDGQGNVSLLASNVTVREILAEWTRIGGSRFLNVERLTGAPLQIPVQFDRQPEGDVLASLLAGMSGYILGPKMVGMAGTSRFGTVVIQATSTATASTSYSPGNNFSNNATAPPPVTRSNPDDEIPPVTPPNSPAGAPAATNPNQGPRSNAPSVGVPANPVIVPIGPAPAPTTPTTPGTTTTGRGRGGGGGSTPR